MPRILLTITATVSVLSCFGSPWSHGPRQQNDVKGQNQLSGTMGQFGATYSLKNKFNIALLDARYTVQPVEGDIETFADKDGKILVLDLAVKNADSTDKFFDPGRWISAIDDKGQVYQPEDYVLTSQGDQGLNVTLKPGQGIGQPALKDPLYCDFKLPAQARITKIIVNQGRLNTSEEVIRFLISPPPTDPTKSPVKNYISALPDGIRDAADAYGALAVDEGKAEIGKFYPSGGFNLQIVDVSSPAGAVFAGRPPDDGKRFVVATVLGHWLMTKPGGIFDLEGGDGASYQLLDTDGEKYTAIGFKKLRSDDDPDRTFQKGDEYSMRAFFMVPKDAKLRHLSFGVRLGRVWGFDLNQG